jgi:hypothetical protein
MDELNDTPLVGSIDDKATVEEARKWVSDRISFGVRCPCCDQFAKVYRRTMTAAMAQALVSMYRIAERADEWVHVPSTLGPTHNAARGGDFAKLRYWGLVRESDGEVIIDGDKKSSGFWKITPQGQAFVRGQVRVPRHIFLYDSVFLRYSDDTIDITEALATSFSYTDLMSGTDPAPTEE